jgi:hypothetical protein
MTDRLQSQCRNSRSNIAAELSATAKPSSSKRTSEWLRSHPSTAAISVIAFVVPDYQCIPGLVFHSPRNKTNVLYFVRHSSRPAESGRCRDLSWAPLLLAGDRHLADAVSAVHGPDPRAFDAQHPCRVKLNLDAAVPLSTELAPALNFSSRGPLVTLHTSKLRNHLLRPPDSSIQIQSQRNDNKVELSSPLSLRQSSATPLRDPPKV